MEVSLALNCDEAAILNNGTIAVNNAMDMCFVAQNCTAFKLQGSSDGGSTYGDIKGTSSLLGAAGTLTASVSYMLSLTRCRFDHIKAVFSGTNPTCTVIRRYIRQSPIVSLDRTKQVTIIDPILGTA